MTILAPTPAGAQEILPWTFDAPGNGAVVDLSETVAVTAVEAVGVMRGPKGDPVDDFTVIDGWLQFYVKGTPVGAPKKLEFGSAEWSTILGKPDVIATGDTEAEARAAIDAVSGQEMADALATTAAALQPRDADLTALAALPTVANRLPYATGPSAWSLTEFSPFGRSVAALADAPAMRVLAGLRIGTDVQAYNAQLAEIAALSIPAGSMFFRHGNGTLQSVGTAAFGRSLLGGTDAAATRTLIGALAASLVGAANGVAPLDANSLIPATYLPSYVDDVLEFATLSAFPAVGETGKIYTALNAGTAADPSKIYRWSGSTYWEISPSPGSTDAVPEGAANLYFTNARADARIAAAAATGTGNIVRANAPTFTGTVSGITKAMVGLGNADNTKDVDKPVSTAQQTALDAKQRKVIDGTTANGASATTKAVTSTITPAAGDIVSVTFTNGNTAGGVALNFNTTTAYPVALAGSTSVNAASLRIGTGGIVLFQFTGSQFQMLGANAHLSVMTQTELDAGSGTTGQLVTPALIKANLDTKQPKATGTTDGSKFLRDDNTWAAPPSGGGGGGGYDTYANMPAANTVPSGYLYRCSDIDSTYRSNGTAWVQTDCGGGPVIGEPPASGWTSVNLGTATVTNDKGTLLLTAPAVNGTTDTLRAVSRPISGNPTITAKLDFHLTQSNGPGVYFGFTDGTKFKLWAFQMQNYKNLVVLRQNWNHATSINGTNNLCDGQAAVFLAQCKWWRLTDNGTSHVFSLSTNGIDWQVIDTISRTDFIASPTAFCLGINTYGSGYTASTRLRQLAIA
ncbi:MAG: hypothetical protein PGN27_05470 [Mycolicibacterium neoaurum]|uniref:hypothetical protein n=1 Tax=Mycolicibacterium neoaurum TaxID=1795 RepID=UPI002FF4634F